MVIRFRHFVPISLFIEIEYQEQAKIKISLKFLGFMSPYKTLLALFGAPAAWISQMLLCESLTSYACYPYRVPLSAPLWADLPVMLAVICTVCLAPGLISGYTAWDTWQRTNQQFAEKSMGDQALEVNSGQSKFLATLGIMSSFIFIVAILFTSSAILLVSLCGQWA